MEGDLITEKMELQGAQKEFETVSFYNKALEMILRRIIAQENTRREVLFVRSRSVEALAFQLISYLVNLDGKTAECYNYEGEIR